MCAKPEVDGPEVIQTRYEWKCDNGHRMDRTLDGNQMDADVPAPPCFCGARVWFWGATLLDNQRRAFEERVAFVEEYARQNGGWGG